MNHKHVIVSVAAYGLLISAIVFYGQCLPPTSTGHLVKPRQLKARINTESNVRMIPQVQLS